jgi:hypothetical protein
MIKGLRLLLILFCVPTFSFSQVGIGTSTPNSSAQLDVTSTTKGFLPPRVALTATNSTTPVTSPATGLLVYNTATAGTSPNNVTPGLYYYDGTKWQRIINQQPDATVSFNTSNPNTGGPTFTPNTPASTDYIYVSSVDNSQWTYNGSTYVTYTPPASTPWHLSSGTSDAGSNKTAAIYRTGNIGIGNTTPNAKLDIRTNPTNTSDPGSGYLGVGTTTTAANTAGAGAVRYSTLSGGGLEFSNGTTWNTLQSNVQKANVYASRTSASTFDVVHNTSNSLDGFNINSGAGNIANVWSSSTGVYTAPRTGLYTISAGMSFLVKTSTSPTGLIHFLVMKGGFNGTEACNVAVPVNYPVNQNMSANISCSVPLNQGETLQIKYHQWSGGTVQIALDPSHQGRYYISVIEN